MSEGRAESHLVALQSSVKPERRELRTSCGGFQNKTTARGSRGGPGGGKNRLTRFKFKPKQLLVTNYCLCLGIWTVIFPFVLFHAVTRTNLLYCQKCVTSGSSPTPACQLDTSVSFQPRLSLVHFLSQQILPQCLLSIIHYSNGQKCNLIQHI